MESWIYIPMASNCWWRWVEVFPSSRIFLSLSGFTVIVKLHSDQINECWEFLIEISSHSKIALSWVLEHRDNARNCIVDELTRAGTELTTFDILQGIGVPIATVGLVIVSFFYVEAQRWCQQENDELALWEIGSIIHDLLIWRPYIALYQLLRFTLQLAWHSLLRLL